MDSHQGPDLVNTQPDHSISGLAFSCYVLENYIKILWTQYSLKGSSRIKSSLALIKLELSEL